MKKIILIISSLCICSMHLAQAQSANINKNPIINKGNKAVVKPLNLNLLKPGQYGSFEFGTGKNKMSIVVEKKYNGKLLKTRELKKKQEDLGNVCVNDFFKTSGQVNSWKVHDDDGNSDDANIVPGTIFDLSKFTGSFFSPIEQYDRNTIRMVITNDQSAQVTSAVVNNPKSASKIREKGTKPIRNTIKNNVAAVKDIGVDFERQYSASQFNITLGGAIPYMGAKIEFGASSSKIENSETYSYVIEATEKYYTLKCDGNNIASKNFFVDQTLNNKKDWGYIESVTYGRKITAVIYSSKSLYEKVDSAGLKISAGKLSVEAEAYYKSQEENESFTYDIFIAGGTSSGTTPSIHKEGDLDDLLADINDVIQDNNKASKFAVPISFVLKDLSGELVVSTYNPIDSKIKSCSPKYEFSLKSIEVLKVNEGIGQNAIELFGTFNVNAYRDNGANLLSSEALANKQQYGSKYIQKDGFVRFAKKSDPIKLALSNKKKDKIYDLTNSDKAGHFQYQLTNDAINGYFEFIIDAKEKDQTTADDVMYEKSKKFYFKDLTGFDEIPIVVNGDGNRVKLLFQVVRK